MSDQSLFEPHIRLLSQRPFAEMTPGEFRTWVISLYKKRTKRIAPRKPKKVKPPFSWKTGKRGNLLLTVNRSPKWLSRGEIEQLSTETKLPLNEIWITIIKKKISIWTAEDAPRIIEELANIPW